MGTERSQREFWHEAWWTMEAQHGNWCLAAPLLHSLNSARGGGLLHARHWTDTGKEPGRCGNSPKEHTV